MKKIGHRITIRTLKDNFLIATMDYLGGSAETVTEEMKTLMAREYAEPVVIRGSRLTRRYSDVQWYAVSTRALKAFSRRLSINDQNEPWRSIHALLITTAKKEAKGIQ